MESKNLIGTIISIAVVVICVAAVMVPILDDAASSTRTYTNAGYYRMADIDGAVTIEWDHTAPTQIKVNDEIVSLASVPRGTITTLVATDGMLIRYAPVTSGTFVQSYSSSGYLGTGSTAGDDMTIEIADGSISATVGTTTYTKSITTGYHVSDSGDWMLKANHADAFVHTSDSLVVLAGNTSVGSSTVGVFASGSIDDGLDTTTVQTNSVTINPTYGDASFTFTEVDDAVDLVKLSKCEFDITVGGTTAPAAYSSFLVPYKVTAAKEHPLSDGAASLISAIPALVIVSLVVLAVEAVRGSRE